MDLAERTGAVVLQPGVDTDTVELVVAGQDPQHLALAVALQADGAALRDGAVHTRVRVLRVLDVGSFRVRLLVFPRAELGDHPFG